jgi:hypothetical protein
MLKLDQKSRKFQRQATSLLDYLSDLGGLFGTISMFGVYVVSSISNRLYLASLIKDSYMFKPASKKNDLIKVTSKISKNKSRTKVEINSK